MVKVIYLAKNARGQLDSSLAKVWSKPILYSEFSSEDFPFEYERPSSSSIDGKYFYPIKVDKDIDSLLESLVTIQEKEEFEKKFGIKD